MAADEWNRQVVEMEKLVKEVAHNEYQSYATGRQNIAFVDVKLSMLKRYNPLIRYGETAASFFFDSVSSPVERMEATAYTFDGKEKERALGEGMRRLSVQSPPAA